MTRASDTARLLGAGATILDGTTISTADNTAQLTLTSTDADSGIGPHQVFYRNSSSPADADLLCELDFRGRNDNSQDVNYATVNVKASDVSDGTEDGEYILQVMTAGSVDTTMHIKPSEIVFNEDSIDRDFRVESNGNANMLFVDGGNDRVGIGTSPSHLLDVLESGSGDATVSIKSTTGGDPTLQFDSAAANRSGLIKFLDQGTHIGRIQYNHDTNSIDFQAGSNSGATMRMLNGNLLLGTTSVTNAQLVSVANLASIHTCTFRNSDNNTGGIFLRQQNHAGQDCGNITQTGSTTVSYGTSSDYRLKENVSYDFDATTRLKQLKPARFNFIADGTDKVVDGFLAHEAQTIVPESVVGEKDATETLKNVVLLANDIGIVASDITEAEWTQGKTDGIYASDTSWTASKTIPKYQQIDQSKLVPLLVKTIQELEARITTLENA
jgi:prepilin-type processing-associated H-X9-DG protein